MSVDLTAITVPALAAAMTLLAWTFILMRSGSASPRGMERARAAPRAGRDRPWTLAIGIVIAGALWLGLDQPVLAAASMLLWTGGVRMMRIRRQRRAESEELQHAIEAISTAGRALRSGIPLAGVLRILATDSRGETRRAFREIEARGALGEDLASSIESVLLTSPIPALRAFGLALIQQIAAGGNLAEVTDRLARSLVERSRIRRRIRTILAYGRAAAIALALTPLLVVPILCQMLDGYAALLFGSSTGHVLLIVASSLLVAGAAAIQRLTGVDHVSARRAM